MDQTAIQAGSTPPKPVQTAVTAGSPPSGPTGTLNGSQGPAPRPTKQVHPLYQMLVWMADLRLTVVLFALAMLIVFWGTLAQVDNGVWTIVQKYFRSFFVLVPLKVVLFNLVPDTKTVIPFPGGWLIGLVMLINLLAAHAIRFKLTWARAGIIMIHAGIIIMMVGEVVTGVYAVEGQMIIRVGETSSTVIDGRGAELAIIRTVDAKTDDVVVVPASRLRTGSFVDDERIPFKIEVTEFMVNSILRDEKNDRATVGFGRVHVAQDMPEVSGTEVGQKIDTPSVYVKLTSRAGKDLKTWLFSTRFADPQWIDVDGKKYKIVLRFKQTSRPFTFHLTQFDHKVFPGDPNKTKDYRSYIHLVDKDQGVDRKLEIYMNSPLYYRGETFYQSGMDRDERGVITTTLQVVRNPGWVMPYASCAIVGIGLLIHFGLTLYRFIDRRMVR
jgi:hypothetical protein